MSTETRATKREHWRTILDQWRQSGLSKAAFCREHGIAAWQFHYWFRRLSPSSPEPDGAFARVECPAGGAGVRLRLPSGAAIEVDRDFDPATLVRLLRAVATQC